MSHAEPPSSPQDLDRHARDVVVKDGRTVHLRAIRADDLDAMMAMWRRLSPDTIRMRFFGPRGMNERQMRYFTELDYTDRFALVAETGGRIVGVGRFDRLPKSPETAEFALLVEDAEQGRGIGTALLRGLVEPAEERGIRHFVGEVLSENRRMLGVLRDAGLQPAITTEGTVVHTEFGAAPTEAFLASGDEQERIATVAALTAVFRPLSVAVAGASRDPRTIGGLVFRNLLRGGFEGPVFPVNPSASFVQSVAAYPTLSDCPTVPELVVVAVPAARVAEVVDEAGRLGSRAAVIISAGFSETGAAGAEAEREVVEIARRHGIRLVGPNCMGVLSAGTDVRLNATFSPVFPPPGTVAFSSQSGALGLAILAAAERLGLGLSSFASVGNKADISGNDLLQYWESDPATDVILLYLESFGNPRRFSRLARRIARTKPIVAVKSGRTAAGERAASSHTGALAAGDVAVDALFRQAGVIRTDSLEELFDVATVLANQPLPPGRRVAILTNGGGPGILAADACESNGLEVPELAAETEARLAEFLPSAAGVGNPVDMVASASAEDFGRAMRVLAADPDVDALLVIFIPPIVTRADDVAQEMVSASADIGPEVPILSVFMSEEGVPPSLARAHIPSFAFPEDAARALGHTARYADWRRRPMGHVVEVGGIDVEAARAVVDRACEDAGPEGVWLDAAQTDALLSAFGITTARARVVHSAEEAVRAAEEIGGKVAVKSAAPVHKTELGGVHLGLETPEAIAQAVYAISRELVRHEQGELETAGFMVQAMAGDGVEMMVGVTHDPTFGPILVAGMGGTLVELLRDVSVRIHPLTDTDVRDMLTSLRGYPLITGYRGAPPADVAALEDLLFRVSALVEEVPEVAELDCNPLFVHRGHNGVTVVDARVRLAPGHRRPRR